MTDQRTLRRRATLVVALAALAPALGGCVTNPETTASTAPVDHRDRHPIVLAQAPRVLDMFVEGQRGYADREQRDLAVFIAEYRRYGSGAMSAQVPTVSQEGAATRTALSRIRGAVGGRLAVSTYGPADPAVASPIRLSFYRLQAKVGSECGLWPEDLGVADYEFGQSNRQYWNLGCAMHSNVASQVADPIDLVRGRQPTRPDTGRRMFNIEKLRQGVDPSTSYKTEGVSVRQGVSQ